MIDVVYILFLLLKVFETGSDRLPKWLSFDSRRNILEGVPASGDGGRLHYMEVSAENIFGGKEETLSKDVFVIDVRTEVAGGTSARPLGDSLHGNATVVCAPGDAVTMATVAFDADFDAMSGSTRTKLIRDFGRHVGLSVTSLTMTSSRGHDDDDDRLDNIPLVAGPGNVVSSKNPNGRVLLIQWVVGCGSVTAGNMRILERLEATAVNGSLTEDTGSGIIGWHVTRSKTPRRKRLVSPPLHHPTATPLQTRGLPVSRPTATRMVSPTDGGPEVRVVPSVVFPGASVTSERPHRSKSRHKTKHGKQTLKPSSRGDRNDPGFKASFRPTPEIQVTGYPDVLDTQKRPDYLEPSLAFPVASVATVPTRRLASSAKMLTTTKMKKSSSPSSDHGKTLGAPVEGGTLPDNNNLPPIWRFSVLVGEVFRYAIPSDTFPRNEVQELVLVTLDGSSRSWIKIDHYTRTLYGLPLDGDVGGVWRLALEGMDNRGKKVERYEVEVAVRRGPNSGPGNHEVKVKLEVDYHQFMGDVGQRIDVATRIAHAHGDRDAADVTVTRILEGSVEFFWSNRSLADADPCPMDALRRMADRMIRTEDGLLDPDFTRAMEPHEVRSVEFTPKGACVSRMEVRTGHRKEEVEEEEEEEEETGSDPGLARSVDGLLLTTIVPILILVVVVLLVLVVVCAVCARRKKNKNRKEEEEKERGGWDAASRKGVPVIFADELEDTPGATPSRVLTGERLPMIAASFPDYDRPSTDGQSPSSPSLVPGREQDAAPAPRRNSPPAYDNGANRSTTGTGTATSAGTGTPHHRRVASSGTRAQQVSRDPPPYVSS